MTTKTRVFEIFFKVDPTKRENGFKKLNHISFVTSAVTENSNFRMIAILLASRKNG